MSTPREPLNEFEAARRDRITQQASEALRGAEDITLILDPQAAVTLIAQLQLALRHPRNAGTSASIAREIALGLIDRLPAGARELLMLGFDARYDA